MNFGLLAVIFLLIPRITLSKGWGLKVSTDKEGWAVSNEPGIYDPFLKVFIQSGLGRFVRFENTHLFPLKYDPLERLVLVATFEDDSTSDSNFLVFLVDRTGKVYWKKVFSPDKKGFCFPQSNDVFHSPDSDTLLFVGFCGRWLLRILLSVEGEVLINRISELDIPSSVHNYLKENGEVFGILDGVDFDDLLELVFRCISHQRNGKCYNLKGNGVITFASKVSVRVTTRNVSKMIKYSKEELGEHIRPEIHFREAEDGDYFTVHPYGGLIISLGVLITDFDLSGRIIRSKFITTNFQNEEMFPLAYFDGDTSSYLLGYLWSSKEPYQFDIFTMNVESFLDGEETFHIISRQTALEETPTIQFDSNNTPFFILLHHMGNLCYFSFEYPKTVFIEHGRFKFKYDISSHQLLESWYNDYFHKHSILGDKKVVDINVQSLLLAFCEYENKGRIKSATVFEHVFMGLEGFPHSYSGEQFVDFYDGDPSGDERDSVMIKYFGRTEDKLEIGFVPLDENFLNEECGVVKLEETREEYRTFSLNNRFSERKPLSEVNCDECKQRNHLHFFEEPISYQNSGYELKIDGTAEEVLKDTGLELIVYSGDAEIEGKWEFLKGIEIIQLCEPSLSNTPLVISLELGVWSFFCFAFTMCGIVFVVFLIVHDRSKIVGVYFYKKKKNRGENENQVEEEDETSSGSSCIIPSTTDTSSDSDMIDTTSGFSNDAESSSVYSHTTDTSSDRDDSSGLEFKKKKKKRKKSHTADTSSDSDDSSSLEFKLKFGVKFKI